MSLFGSDYTLLDLLKEPAWTAPIWAVPTVREEKIVNATEEMSIIPDTEHGPMLEIGSRDERGMVIYRQRLNLAAVGDLIGKLIKTRDHMAQMKGESR